MVLFDATTLLLLLSPNTLAPIDPKTGKPVTRPKDRIDYLIHLLQLAETKILVPTPALSEILVRAGKAGPQYLPIFDRSSVFRIVPFDTRAAIEVSIMARDSLQKGKKVMSPMVTYAKIKYDRQIVAIAKTFNVTAIYSDDKTLLALARAHSMTCHGLTDLPLPPEEPQIPLAFKESLKTPSAELKT